jgi:hypothetical protein
MAADSYEMVPFTQKRRLKANDWKAKLDLIMSKRQLRQLSSHGGYQDGIILSDSRFVEVQGYTSISAEADSAKQ